MHWFSAHPGAMAISLLVCAVALGGCPQPPDDPYAFTVHLRVVDEAGEPIAGALIDAGDALVRTDGEGEVDLPDRRAPTLTVVRAQGYLSEPITIDRSDAERERVDIALFAREGPGGRPRWSMHSGGDTMFSRRYLDVEDGDPLLPSRALSAGARDVVADLARSFSTADYQTLDFESVIGELDEAQRYPGKRSILQSPPEALAGLLALSVDLATLGNNHAYDFRDLGIAATTAALDAAGIAYAGVTLDPELPTRPSIFEPHPGVRAALFSFTTVDGDFVNDSYPSESAPVPADCEGPSPASECFKYEARSWGFTGESVAFTGSPRRIGTAWKLFRAAEFDMPADDRLACWSSLYAVYPELQDWVARRGHGGAAPWDADLSSAAIASTLSAGEAEIVIVQLHSGFQFQSAPSATLRTIARQAIDAGAEIVIAHHPHTLQGVEWYRDKLIVYSLGNLVFDQDFLATFPSAYLRTIWEGETLLEARLLPIELVDYRPIPTAGPAARRTAASLWEFSDTRATSSRDLYGDVHRYFTGTPDEHTKVAAIHSRHHDAVIDLAVPPVETVALTLDGPRAVELDFDGLIHAQAKGALVDLGRELFGWGHLEDALVDTRIAPAAQWFMPQGGFHDPVLRLDHDAANGLGWIEMYRNSSFTGDTYARPVARIPLPEHRLYTDDGGTAIPADGEASYSIRLRGRLRGGGHPYIRVELFTFDNTNPGEDPTTIPIGEPLDLPLELEADGRWHTAELSLPPGALVQDQRRANVAEVQVRFGPPERGESVFAFDDFAFIEWRDATRMQDHFGDYGFVRGQGRGPLTLDGMALRRD